MKQASSEAERLRRALAESERRNRDLERELRRARSESRGFERKFRRAEGQVRELRDDNRGLRRQVARLKVRLAREGDEEEADPLPAFVKPKVEGERKPHPGNPGHCGASRRAPKKEEVDETVTLKLEACPSCGTSLGQPIDRWKRSVEDIAPAETVKRWIIILVYWCPTCKAKVWKPYDGALPRKRLGIYLAAFVAFLRTLGLTLEKIQKLLNEVWSLKLSRQAIQEAAESVAGAFGPQYARLLKYMRRAKSKRGDETTWRVNGKPGWAWVMAWNRGAVFHCDPKRSGAVVKKLLGKHPRGVLGRDGWQAYNKAMRDQQLDLVHINRDLQKIEVRKGIKPRGFLLAEPPKFTRRGHPPEEFLRCARLVRQLMADAVRFVEKKPGPRARMRAHARFVQRYKALASRPWKDKRVRSFFNGLRRNRATEFMFTFLRITGIPWHNNDAEQAIRPMVVNRKMSYGSRSDRGAKTTAVLQSMAETQRRLGRDLVRFLRQGLSVRAAKG